MPTMTSNDFEQMRNAVTRHYEQTNHELRDTFIAELKRGAIFEEDNRFGLWTLETRAGKLALVRLPPVASEMHYFGAYLRKEDQAWIVEGDFHTEERLNLGE